MSVISYAPTFKVLREVSAADVPASAIKRQGANLADFDEVTVMLSLHGTMTAATLQLYFWSDAAGKFVAESTPVTLAVTATGVLGRLKVHRHPHVLFAITSVTGTGSCKIEVAGAPEYHKVG